MPDTTEMKRSVQSFPDAKAGGGDIEAIASNLVASLGIFGTQDCCPPYWSRARDKWLRKFVTMPGNDILAGAVATVASKFASTGWSIEGPERTANVYRRMLLQQSEFGAGWQVFAMKGGQQYLTQDAGWPIERIRSGRKGSMLGIANFDNEQIRLTCDPIWPAKYTPRRIKDGEDPKTVPLHYSQFGHIEDSPSPSEKLCGVGFCAVSRAWMTAHILVDIALYERERLSDLPPAGILMVNNMQERQWKDLMDGYHGDQQRQGNNVYRDILVAFGLDPTIPVSAELFSFADLPEHFDKRTTTEIAVYSFALAFGIDPRELWPVSAGTLGTATEANIQHLKARGKGAALLTTGFERLMNDGLSIAPSCTFRFDYVDTEEDQAAADIAKTKAEYISALTTPGIVSTEEARAWLVKEGLFDEEDLATFDEEGVATDVETAKSAIDMGPRVRAYSDGRTVHLQRKLWPVAKAGAYKCECLDCGATLTTDKHCVDITCPKCGGDMRRAERPGRGRSDPLGMAAENYLSGAIEAGQLAEYAMSLAVEAHHG